MKKYEKNQSSEGLTQGRIMKRLSKSTITQCNYE